MIAQAGISTEAILGIVGTVLATGAAIAIGVYQARAGMPKRSRLKLEVEILNLIGDDHEHSERLRASAEKQLEILYGPPRDPADPRHLIEIPQIRYLNVLVGFLGSVSTSVIAFTDLGGGDVRIWTAFSAMFWLVFVVATTRLVLSYKQIARQRKARKERQDAAKAWLRTSEAANQRRRKAIEEQEN